MKQSSKSQVPFKSSIDADQFLKNKQIQIEHSEFLSNHYASKSLNLRQSYNPKDIHGKRLSSFWREGDTIKTVILKKMRRNTTKVFNPDTYTKKQLIDFKENLIKDKFNVMALILVVMAPTLVLHPLVKPRLKAIRRQMIFQYYLQAGMLSRQLKTPLQKIPKQQIEKIINKANEKISF